MKDPMQTPIVQPEQLQGLVSTNPYNDEIEPCTGFKVKTIKTGDSGCPLPAPAQTRVQQPIDFLNVPNPAQGESR